MCVCGTDQDPMHQGRPVTAEKYEPFVAMRAHTNLPFPVCFVDPQARLLCRTSTALRCVSFGLVIALPYLSLASLSHIS